MNKVQKLQSWGLSLWLGAGVAASTAPNYNGIWLISVVLFVVGGLVMVASTRQP